MKPIKTYIHRILFRLGFCRKEAKEIFYSASVNANISYYMCERISEVLYSKGYIDSLYPFNKHARYMRAYGFTRKNYHEFVKDKYPELVRCLKYPPHTYWILPNLSYYIGEVIDELSYYKIIESKNAFLKHLADKL